MKKLRYLIVDDEEMIRNLLASYFERYGIESDSAANALEARQLLVDNSYDLATVDVVMPGENGIELTKWIKAKIGIPVVLLTSLDEAVDMVAGLEIGADDYVSKPFDPRVLLARSKAVLRRSSQVNELLAVERTLRTNDRVLSIDGNKHSLNSSEFSLLKSLIVANGEAVSREALFLKVFDKEWSPEDRGIDNIVARLRQKVEPVAHTPKYIITVRHRGYLVPRESITLED